jgi:hypothetical protein
MYRSRMTCAGRVAGSLGVRIYKAVINSKRLAALEPIDERRTAIQDRIDDVLQIDGMPNPYTFGGSRGPASYFGVVPCGIDEIPHFHLVVRSAAAPQLIAIRTASLMRPCVSLSRYGCIGTLRTVFAILSDTGSPRGASG